MAQPQHFHCIIPETDMTAIKGAIGVLQAKLMPHLRTLKLDEKAQMPKMGDKTVAFVQKTYEYGQKNGELIPTFLDFGAMDVDIRAVQCLRDLVQTLTPMLDALNDSVILAGSEAYQAALLFYNNVKIAAKAKAPNAATIYEDLSNQFPGKSSRGRSRTQDNQG